MLIYALQVYSDVYSEFLYNHLNVQGAPLYTESQSEKCYVKSEYMSESYYNRTKRYYETYLENKKLVYPNLYSNDDIVIPRYINSDTLLNIYYVTIDNYKSIELTRSNLMDNLDNITFDVNTDLTEDDIVIFTNTYKKDFTNDKNICWFITDFFVDNIKEYLENESNIELNSDFNIELDNSGDDINLYILRTT